MRIPAERIHGDTLAQQIRSALAGRILAGVLPPGTRLKDNEIAECFGTSNTPVREALRGLAKDGLVEILPYRGCIVRRVSRRELEEALEVRAALESLATWLAAERLSDDQLQALTELVEEHEDAIAARDRDRALELGTRFHRAVVEAANNDLLARTLQDLSVRMRLARQVYAYDVDEPDYPGHRAVLDALLAHDSRQAAILMAGHISHSRRSIAQMLQSDSEQGEP